MKTLLLLLILITGNSFAQEQVINILNRNIISLNGDWSVIIDPYQNGYNDYRYQENPNGYFKNAKPKSKSDLVEYDFDSSDKLKVPSDWNTQRKDLFPMKELSGIKNLLSITRNQKQECLFILAQ